MAKFLKLNSGSLLIKIDDISSIEFLMGSLDIYEGKDHGWSKIDVAISLNDSGTHPRIEAIEFEYDLSIINDLTILIFINIIEF